MNNQNDLEAIKKDIADECGNDCMNELKAEAAWVLGLEEGSDEWEELMDI